MPSASAANASLSCSNKIPVAAVAWWQGFNCLGIVGVVCVVTGAMALRRYDETTRPLLARQRFAMGRVSWEKNQSVGKQKAEVRYVSSRQDSDYSFVDHVLRSDFLSHDQLAGMARSILECGKFNQDVVCKGAKISASDYGRLANEMIEQGMNALRPTGQKGYNITKSGYDLLGQLVGSTPPLLN